MKKIPKFKNHFNSIPDQGKSIKGPSKTIPDQSMTISEIMRRFASGLPVEGAKVSVYDGEDELLPDMAKMDLADRQELLEQTRDQVRRLQAQLREKKLKDSVTEEDQGEEVQPMKTKNQPPAGKKLNERSEANQQNTNQQNTKKQNQNPDYEE